MRNMAVAKIDKTGRVYLPRALRRAAGIASNSVLDVEAREGQVILRKRQTSIAESARGTFRLKVRLPDVDKAVRELSRADLKKELDEIRRR